MRDFKGLDVWRTGHALALNVHRVVRTLPRSGYNSLKTQITKSAESIPFNIVEGCAASTPKEFARYLDISICQLERCQLTVWIPSTRSGTLADLLLFTFELSKFSRCV